MEEQIQPPAFVAPIPWIETYQRAQCDGSAAMRTFQKLIADEIVLPKSAMAAADPAVLVGASTSFASSMLDDAMLLPGEFAQEALWSYYAHDYVRQVSEGGHVQYFANRGEDELALRCTQSGLKSMIADPHLALFTELVKLRRTEPKLAKKAAEKAGFRNIDAAIRDLDRRMGELEQSEPLMPRHRTWLKSLRKLRVVPDEELHAQLNRIAQANPLHARRRAERERVRAETQAHDPVVETARSLCEMAGLRLASLAANGMTQLRAAWPEGPNRNAMAWRLHTDRGVRTVLIYEDGGVFKKRLAVLIEPGEALPLGSVALSPDVFATLAPQLRG